MALEIEVALNIEEIWKDRAEIAKGGKRRLLDSANYTGFLELTVRV